jgi:hypothetical protein
MIFSIIGLKRPYLDHLAGLDREESLSTEWHERQQILHAVRFRAEDQDGDIPASHFLLVFDIPVAGEQHIPLTFRKRKKLAVLLGPIACSAYRFALMAQCRHGPLQRSGKALTDQDFIFRSVPELAPSLLPTRRWLAPG